MGLFDIFRSPSLKWRCQSCGHVHRKNPDKCSECGHTVLIQHRGSTYSSSPSSNPSTPTQEPAEPNKSEEWVCMHCKQSFDEEWDECKVCGHEELKLVGETSESRTAPLVDEDYDGPMISNAREAGINPENAGNRSLLLILIIFVLLLILVGLFVSGPL